MPSNDSPTPNRLLHLDTASPHLMVGVSAGAEMIFRHREANESQRHHSAVLFPTLERALRETGTAWQELAGVAVNAGPGSFTGIRTGLTAVRTMAQFLETPLYLFNSFELLPPDYYQAPRAIYLDALRGNAYHAALEYRAGAFHYHREASLVTLSEEEPPKGEPAVVSASLQPLFPEGRTIPLESLEVFTPNIMLQWLLQNPEPFRKPWREALPLYLQQPNITQRKPRAGRLK